MPKINNEKKKDKIAELLALNYKELITMEIT
jgi:hypothetical protein